MKNLIFIDVDGTLTYGLSSWERIHHYFEKYDPKMVEKMDANTALWREGKIDYHTWAEMDVALWKGYPVADLQKALLPPLLIKNAREGIQLLKQNDFHVVLVSGGINIMVDEVKRIVGADEAYANNILHKDGLITGEIEVPVGNSKVDVCSVIIERENIPLQNTYAIGDHINDKEMFEHVNYALGINVKHEDLHKYTNECIETKDLMDAVKIILKN